MTPSLREAAERCITATADERRAMLVDLHFERAECVYRIEHAKARVAVLETLLAATTGTQPRTRATRGASLPQGG